MREPTRRDGGCDLAVDGNRETSVRDSSCSQSVPKVPLSDHIMNSWLLVIFALLTIVAVNAQKAARIGPDGKPLLNRPDLAECEKRKNSVVVTCNP